MIDKNELKEFILSKQYLKMPPEKLLNYILIYSEYHIDHSSYYICNQCGFQTHCVSCGCDIN